MCDRDGEECCTLVRGEQGVMAGEPQYPELLVVAKEVWAICKETAVSLLTLAKAGGFTAKPGGR